MKKIKKEIAKLVSSSGDLWGASWVELIKIRKLVELFKSYARSLVPEKRVLKGECHQVMNLEDEGTYNQEKSYSLEEIYFSKGYNQCREEMLRRIEESGDMDGRS